jgi:ComF family protein
MAGPASTRRGTPDDILIRKHLLFWRVRRAVFSSSDGRIRGLAAAADAAPIALMRRAAASLLNSVFPSDCRLCGAPLTNISRLPVCDVCLAAVRPMAGDLCLICSERLFTFGDQPPAGEERICGLCRRARPPYQRAVAFGEYNGELRELLHLLKYEGMQPAAGFLGGLLAQGIKELALNRLHLIVPVPLHAERLRQRRFNQAELLARAAQRRLGTQCRVEAGILRRTRATDSQTGLTRHQRRANVRGAFRVTRNAVVDQTIVVVDDVFTTGITAGECARVLMRAGAKQVFVATVARVLKGEAARLVPATATASA